MTLQYCWRLTLEYVVQACPWKFEIVYAVSNLYSWWEQWKQDLLKEWSKQSWLRLELLQQGQMMTLSFKEEQSKATVTHNYFSPRPSIEVCSRCFTWKVTTNSNLYHWKSTIFQVPLKSLLHLLDLNHSILLMHTFLFLIEDIIISLPLNNLLPSFRWLVL